MKETQTRFKLKDLNDKYNYLMQALNQVHTHSVNNTNQLIISLNVLKKLVIEKGLIDEDGLEKMLKNEVDILEAKHKNEISPMSDDEEIKS